eukprot:1157698-Pelagomonas_calceolata.AAC.1
MTFASLVKSQGPAGWSTLNQIPIYAGQTRRTCGKGLLATKGSMLGPRPSARPLIRSKADTTRSRSYSAAGAAPEAAAVRTCCCAASKLMAALHGH